MLFYDTILSVLVVKSSYETVYVVKNIQQLLPLPRSVIFGKGRARKKGRLEKLMVLTLLILPEAVVSKSAATHRIRRAGLLPVPCN